MEKKTNKQLITNPGPHRFSPVSSGSFIAELHLIFRAIIQFELIFVKSVRSASRLLCVCACGQQLLQHRLWRDSPFYAELLLLLCQSSVGCVVCVCFWALRSVTSIRGSGARASSLLRLLCKPCSWMRWSCDFAPPLRCRVGHSRASASPCKL